MEMSYLVEVYAKLLIFLKIGAKNGLNLLKLGAKNESNLLKLGAKNRLA